MIFHLEYVGTDPTYGHSVTDGRMTPALSQFQPSNTCVPTVFECSKNRDECCVLFPYHITPYTLVLFIRTLLIRGSRTLQGSLSGKHY